MSHRVRVQVLTLSIIVIMLVPAISIAFEPILTVQMKKNSTTSSYSYLWPDPEEITLPGLIESAVRAGIDALEGKPEVTFEISPFSIEYCNVKLPLELKLMYITQGKYRIFTIAFSLQIYDSLTDALEFTGPLSLLNLILNPSALIAMLTGIKTTPRVVSGGSIELWWDMELGQFKTIEGYAYLKFYYEVEANLLLLLANHIAPVLGTIAYQTANFITLGSLDHWAVATGTVGLEAGIRFHASDSGLSSSFVLKPYGGLEILIPDEGVVWDNFDFEARVSLSGEFEFNLLSGSLDEAFHFTPDVSLSLSGNVLGNVFDYTRVLQSEDISGIIVDSSTYVSGFRIADGASTCIQDDNINIEAVLRDPSGNPLSSETILFEYEIGPGTWATIGTDVTDAQGKAQINWLCSLVPNEYALRARYAGSGSYDASVSSTSSLKVEPDLTNLTLSELAFSTPEEYLIVRPGESIHISTMATAQGIGAIIGEEVDFYISNSDRTSWTCIGSATTGGWGYAHIDWVVPASLPGGNHYFRAAYLGNNIYTPAASDGEIRLVIESVRITSPSNDETIGTTTPLIELDISEGVIHDSVVFQVDSNPEISLPSGTSAWVCTFLSEGTHTVRVYLKSGSTIKGTDYITIEVDADHPVIISSPSNGAYTMKSFTVTWSWSGLYTLDYYEVLINGEVYYSYLPNTALSIGVFSFNTGECTVIIRAHHSEGIDDASVSVIVDGTPPIAVITNPTSGSTIGSNSVNLQWSSSDNYGLDYFEVYINNLLYSTIYDGGATQTTLSVPSGPCEIKLVAYDFAQHDSEHSILITVITSEPCIRIDSPESGSEIGIEDVTVSWTWYSLSAAISYSVYIDGVFYHSTTSTQTTVTLATGDHSITVRGSISGGSYAESITYVKIDFSIALLTSWGTSVSEPKTGTILRVLDFNGDGIDEIVYAWHEIVAGAANDENHIEVYSSTGSLIFSWIRISENDAYEEIHDITECQIDSDDAMEFAICVWSWVIAFNSIPNSPYYEIAWQFHWGNLYMIDAGDIDNDGYDEIWAPGQYVLIDHDGSEMWSIGTDPSYALGGNLAEKYPAVIGNFDADPELEVLKGTPHTYPASTIYCGDSDGSLLWSTTLSDTFVEPLFTCGDVDGDGIDEVFVYDGTRGILLDSDGTKIWEVELGTDRIYYALVADVTGDESAEIMVCVDWCNLTMLDASGTVMHSYIASRTLIHSEWDALSLREIQVMNADNDENLEIVVLMSDAALVLDCELHLVFTADNHEHHTECGGASALEYDGIPPIEFVILYEPPVSVYRITVDDIAPTITIDAPLSSDVVQCEFLLNWTASDNDQISYTEIFVDGILYSTTSATEITLQLLEGDYIIRATVYDRSGNSAEDSIDISVDSTPPDITIVSPISGINVTTMLINIGWSSTGANRYTVKLGASTIAQTTMTSCDVNLPNGLFCIYVFAYDEANNMDNDSVWVRVDSIAPEFDFISPDNETILSNMDLILSWSAEDIGTGISNYSIYLNTICYLNTLNHSATISLESGWNNVTIACSDIVGNSQTRSVYYFLDTVAPSSYLCNPLNYSYFDSSILIQTQTSDNNGVGNVYVSVDGGQSARISDFSGTATEKTHSLMKSVPDLVEGNHIFLISAYDTVGNMNTSTWTVFLFKDTEMPEIEITSPSGQLYTHHGIILLTWTVSDTHQVSHQRIYANDTFIVELNGTSYELILDEGMHNVSILAFDTANHTSSDFVLVIVDMTNPSVSITTNLEEISLHGSVVLDISVADASPVSRVELRIDGVSLSNDTEEPWRVQFDADDLAEGNHILAIYAFDLAGNQGYVEAVVKIGEDVTTTPTTSTTTSTTTTATDDSTTTTDEPTTSNPIDSILGFFMTSEGLIVIMFFVIIIILIRRRGSS